MKRCDGKYARNPTRNICRACIRRPKIAKENCKKTCKWFILAFIFFTGLKTRGKFKTKCDIFLTCVLAFLIALLFAIFDRFAFPEPGFWILFFYFASSEISTNNYENCPPQKKKKHPSMQPTDQVVPLHEIALWLRQLDYPTGILSTWRSTDDSEQLAAKGWGPSPHSIEWFRRSLLWPCKGRWDDPIHGTWTLHFWIRLQEEVRPTWILMAILQRGQIWCAAWEEI